MYFEGELVRYFYDGVEIENGIAVAYEYLNEKGTVDLYTTRKAISNKDGSVDPFGELTGIKRYSQEEFDNRDLSALYGSSNAVTYYAYATGVSDPIGESFADHFAKYKKFGIEYVEAEGASGTGNVYYNGQLVGQFADLTPDGGAFTFSSAKQGGITVKTVYDNNGKLAGVKTVME